MYRCGECIKIKEICSDDYSINHILLYDCNILKKYQILVNGNDIELFKN